MKNGFNIDKHIGDCLRRVRIFRGMGRLEFATAVGLPINEVETLESGRKQLSHEWLLKIASVLDVPVHFFFRGLFVMADNDNGDACDPPEALLTAE